MAIKVLAFSGSLRKHSFNKKLVHNAAVLAESAGALVTEISLADYPLPLFNEDSEAETGMPDNGKRLKAMFADHNALIIGSPEYNGGITAVLKNTIDWISRPDGSDLKPFQDKWVALLSASPGALGGIRALPNVRFILSGLGCIVIPDQLAVNTANTAFAEDGSLVSMQQKQRLTTMINRLVDFATP